MNEIDLGTQSAYMPTDEQETLSGSLNNLGKFAPYRLTH